MEKKLIKLSDRSILEVKGSESEKFLQGIITCNVEKIKNVSIFNTQNSESSLVGFGMELLFQETLLCI